MRKVKVSEILAAAIAAVPGVAFAGDEPAYEPRFREWSPTRQTAPALSYQSGRYVWSQTALGSIGGGPEANVDATFTNLGNSVSWTEGANWSTSPQVPDGTTAIARFVSSNGGALTALPSTAINLERLFLNDFYTTQIIGTPTGGGATAGGTITFNGGAEINANVGRFEDYTDIFFFRTFTGSNDIGGAGTNSVTVAGSAGLNKTGNTHAQLSNNNTFTGAVNVSGGGLLSSITGDGAFGAAANAINLDNGTIHFATAAATSGRVYTMGPGGGTIFRVGDVTTAGAGVNRAFILNGPGQIAGSGTFNFYSLGGAATNNTNMAGTFNTANSHTGTVHLQTGTFNIAGASGAFASSSQFIINGGMLLTSGNNNRMNDAAPVLMTGGQLQAANTETLGAVTFGGSTNVLIASGTGQLTAATLTRNNNGTARVFGDNLGSTTKVIVTGGVGGLTAGLVPWAYSNVGTLTGLGAESGRNTTVTYDAVNGFVPTPIDPANFVSDPTAAVAGTGLRLSSFATASGLAASPGAGTPTLNAARTAKSLVISANGTEISEQFIAPAPNTGYTFAGTGTLTIESGVIVSANSGQDDQGANNSDPGNIVNVALQAPSGVPFYIHTPSAITFNGKMSGNAGLVKAGGRTAFFNSQTSDYTGDTYLTGFNRWQGNVIAGSPGPFGSSTTPIVLYGGNINPKDNLGTPNGTFAAILALDDPQAGPSTFSRPMSIRGPNGAVLRNFANAATGTSTLSGPISIETGSALLFQSFTQAATGDLNNNSFVVTGVISGGGDVQYSGDGTGSVDDLFVTLSAANTYTGDTEANATVNINVDTVGTAEAITSGPFGTGRLLVSGATFNAVGGPRTIQNPVFAFLGTVGLGNQMTIAGPMQMPFGNGVVEVNDTNVGTISGNIVAGGGGIFKQGTGTLVLSGNNTFEGVINVGNGSVAGGVVAIDSNNAFGDDNFFNGVNADATGGGNTLLLRGGRTIATTETIFLRGTGTGGMGGVHGAGGVNTYGGSVVAQAQYANAGTTSVSVLSQKMTLGADAGSTLRIGGTVFTVDPGSNDGTNPVNLAPSIGIQKIGAGEVGVGSATFTATRIGGATSSFQGSVVATGSLEVSAGTLKITANSGTPGGGSKSTFDVTSLSIAAGSKLDITNNAGIVDYTGASPISTIGGLIRTAYAGGAWTGNGITSSLANSGEYAVGFAEASDVLGVTAGTDALWNLGVGNNAVVDDTAVLIRFTRYGDADLSGTVGLDDFNRLASNFNTNGKSWAQGNFNYDLTGEVNLDDFNLLAGNFNLSAGPDGVVDPEDWAALAAAIPEPTTLSLVGLAGAALLRRKRRI